MSGDKAKYRRMQLLNEKGVPTQTEVREQLGSPLAEIFFDSLDLHCQYLMGVAPVLSGPVKTPWISPSDILMGHLKLTSPPTDRHVRATTHKAVLDMGEIVVVKFQNEMRMELEKALQLMGGGLRKDLAEKLQQTYDEAYQEEHKICEESKEKIIKKFMKNFVEQITAIQSDKDRRTLAKIQNERAELHTFMEEQRQYALYAETEHLRINQETKLSERVEEQKQEFVQFLHFVKEETTLLLIDLQTKYVHDMNSLRCEMEASNMAHISIAIADEREKCSKEREHRENEFQTRIAALQLIIEENMAQIPVLETQVTLLREEVDLWEDRVKLIVREFQRFINTALQGVPGQTEFLLSLESLLNLEIQLINRIMGIKEKKLERTEFKKEQEEMFEKAVQVVESEFSIPSEKHSTTGEEPPAKIEEQEEWEENLHSEKSNTATQPSICMSSSKTSTEAGSLADLKHIGMTESEIDRLLPYMTPSEVERFKKMSASQKITIGRELTPTSMRGYQELTPSDVEKIRNELCQIEKESYTPPQEERIGKPLTLSYLAKLSKTRDSCEKERLSLSLKKKELAVKPDGFTTEYTAWTNKILLARDKIATDSVKKIKQKARENAIAEWREQKGKDDEELTIPCRPTLPLPAYVDINSVLTILKTHKSIASDIFTLHTA